MFYSKDILTRKDNSLGLIWLAAMMGSHRSGINKLSKKDVNNVNIVKTCMDISQPSEPFALRFSSNLMVGVTRVYAKQYSFYHIDVNNMWVRLKRDLAEVQSSDIIMLQPEARLVDFLSCTYMQ
ncbi:Rad21/Rec8-like protein [Lobosporangium transversale]|uniref:Rad21/Rec8-like protein n=1 Tax=Lobosporangium transversale TaxID=64571 RepID=A0A1Y2G7R0_9FUNG|nr:Rad21/Rec8-like protein [Lobosporangium transversale]ORZ01853.1 Rad21/Rec8-like protein [Lobosporangium transversale]|eukprot:XP_021876150.1 Rad21/Rec8-like protein [Lobosporangium transversale]